MADFDWSMPLFEFFDSPTWQEISNDREIFLTSFYRKFTGHKHLKSLSSRTSRIKIGNNSKIPSFWNSSKLHIFIGKWIIFPEWTVRIKMLYSLTRDLLRYLIVLSVILRRLNQIQNALPMFDFCFHSKYCIRQNKFFSTQITTKNMPKNNHFRKHNFTEFGSKKSIFAKIHSIFDGPK